MYSLEHEHTLVTVESFLEKNLLSDLSGVKRGRSGDLLGPSYVSSLVDDSREKAAAKICHDQPDFKRYKKCVHPQGCTFTDAYYVYV